MSKLAGVGAPKRAPKAKNWTGKLASVSRNFATEDGAPKTINWTGKDACVSAPNSVPPDPHYSRISAFVYRIIQLLLSLPCAKNGVPKTLYWTSKLASVSAAKHRVPKAKYWTRKRASVSRNLAGQDGVVKTVYLTKKLANVSATNGVVKTSHWTKKLVSASARNSATQASNYWRISATVPLMIFLPFPYARKSAPTSTNWTETHAPVNATDGAHHTKNCPNLTVAVLKLLDEILQVL